MCVSQSDSCVSWLILPKISQMNFSPVHEPITSPSCVRSRTGMLPPTFSVSCIASRIIPASHITSISTITDTGGADVYDRVSQGKGRMSEEMEEYCPGIQDCSLCCIRRDRGRRLLARTSRHTRHPQTSPPRTLAAATRGFRCITALHLSITPETELETRT